MQILTQGGGFFVAENGVNSNRLLTQGGGYITVHSVRSNEASFYIMDYEESNGESYDKK